MHNKVLEVAGFTKSVAGFIAVNRASFSYYEGEIRGVIGLNSSGKSTVSNLVRGALAPAAGSTRFRGAEIGGLPADRICQIRSLVTGG